MVIIDQAKPSVPVSSKKTEKWLRNFDRSSSSRKTNEIITATSVTPGDVNEAHELISLVDQHEGLTATTVDTVVADSKYGTIENFLLCHDQNIKAHIPDLHRAKGTKKGIFRQDQFEYDPEEDVYHCPAGNILKRRALHAKRQSIDYGCPRKICAACDLREQCTKNKQGRTIKRHIRQEELSQMRQKSASPIAKKDIKTRQHLMERSFARGERLGMKRARWRGLWRMEIQEYLTCIVQNIQVLISRIGPNKEAAVNAVKVENPQTALRKARISSLPLWYQLFKLKKGWLVEKRHYWRILFVPNQTGLF